MLESSSIPLPFHPRVKSVIDSPCLDKSVTGYERFDLHRLELNQPLEFNLPENLRLGHLVERIVSELLHSSENYTVIFDNLQITTNHQTLGELDFIVQEKKSLQLTHFELAYKFYLFDNSLSKHPIKNWIGPNRNDTLHQKLEKLKTKQFPLLHHPEVANVIGGNDTALINQSLCFMSNLYVPWQSTVKIPANLAHAVKGFYMSFIEFKQINHSNILYAIPGKLAWGMDPARNVHWSSFNDLKFTIERSIEEKRSILCWQKEGNDCSSFFIVWW